MGAAFRRPGREPTVDVLSDVLRVVRLSGAVFFTADFSSPWAIESPMPEMLAAAVMPQAECVVLFHILVDGSCEVTCPDHPMTTMEAGDVVVFPRGDQHVMRSHPTASKTPLTSVFSPVNMRSPRSCRSAAADARHASSAAI